MLISYLDNLRNASPIHNGLVEPRVEPLGRVKDKVLRLELVATLVLSKVGGRAEVVGTRLGSHPPKFEP
jgi:hypothetical protein